MKKISSMDTVTLLIPHKHFFEVSEFLRDNKIRHMPFLRTYPGYQITIENGPMATMLVLKFASPVKDINNT